MLLLEYVDTKIAEVTTELAQVNGDIADPSRRTMPLALLLQTKAELEHKLRNLAETRRGVVSRWE
jgi:hypothetical protein